MLRMWPLGLWSLLAVVGIWTLVFVCHVVAQAGVLGYQEAWATTFDQYSISAMLPVFADLRTITHGVECWSHGIDVYAIDPCDPWGRPTNYPTVWLEVARVIGADRSWTVPIGLSFAAGFGLSALAFFGRRRAAWQGVLYGVILISPPMLLGIERGNPDIFVFSLLVIGLFLSFGATSTAMAATGVFIAATVLKLFPIWSAAILLVRGGRVSWMALGIVLAGAAYFTLNADYLASISANTSRGTILAFGAEVAFNGLADRLDWPGLTGAIVPALLLVSASAIALGVFLGRRYAGILTLPQNRFGGGFAIGGAIYLFSFAVAANWDYRLCFLLLCVPQWFDWVAARDAPIIQRVLALAMLIAFLASAYLSNRMPFAGFFVDEVFNWLLFFILAAIVTVQIGRVLIDSRAYLRAVS